MEEIQLQKLQTENAGVRGIFRTMLRSFIKENTACVAATGQDNILLLWGM